jgi:hypothetical protein
LPCASRLLHGLSVDVHGRSDVGMVHQFAAALLDTSLPHVGLQLAASDFRRRAFVSRPPDLTSPKTVVVPAQRKEIFGKGSRNL